MTVHMFRCYIGPGKMSVSDLDARINEWVASNAEWIEDNTPHELMERNTRLDGTGATYYALDVRFHKEESKANLLQKFTDKFTEKVAWYRVGYHDCSHDESSPSACEWQDKTEWVAKDTVIPSGVPVFEVTG